MEFMMKPSKSFTRSTLGVTCVGLLMFTTSLSSHANDSDRITQLEKQVQELKLRLNNLEAQRSPSAPSSQNKSTASNREATRPAANKTDMKVLAQWQGLKKGMSPDEVRAVLGAPLKTLANSAFTYWDYANQGSVTFTHGRLSGWTEPN